MESCFFQYNAQTSSFTYYIKDKRPNEADDDAWQQQTWVLSELKTKVSYSLPLFHSTNFRLRDNLAYKYNV